MNPQLIIPIQRLQDDKNATIGFMSGRFGYFTLEDEDRLSLNIPEHRRIKIPGETRIPAGRYRVLPRYHGKFFKAYSTRWGHKYVLEIMDVPGFTDVLFHTLNTEEQTEGCIGIGFSADVQRTARIGASRPAYEAFFSHVSMAIHLGHDVFVDIRDELR